MKKRTNRIVLILLCLVLLLSLTSCRFPKIGRHVKEEPTTEQTTTEQETSTTEATFQLPEYYHYDPDEFYKDCDKMASLYAEGKKEEAFDLYDHLLSELKEIDELSNIAYIKYAENVYDSYYEKEYDYESEVLTTATDRFYTSCHQIASGQNPDAFRSFAGEELFENFKDYEPMTEEQLANEKKELRLEAEYFSAAETLEDTTCTIKGKEYRLGDLISEKGEALYDLNPDVYLDAFYQCYKSYNDLVGKIFVDLLKLRAKIAASYGYSNYADYADQELYYRDFDPEELDDFKSMVKYYAATIKSYYAVFSENSESVSMSDDQILSGIETIFSRMSPMTKEAFATLKRGGLYSLGSEKERMEGAFTTFLPKSNVPYLVVNGSDNSRDIISFAHEFGHFTAFVNMPEKNYLLDNIRLDVEEIHSQGLQLLFGEVADPVFGENRKKIQAANVMRVASAIVDGCVYDDWQREVYANPDMTLEEVNACYKKVLTEYGIDYDFPGLEFGWCEIPHNFDAPMYYLSYAISAVAALQIWDISRSDFDKGVSTWEKLIEIGSNTESYSDTMKQAGLKTVFDTDAMEEILDDTTYYAASFYTLRSFLE